MKSTEIFVFRQDRTDQMTVKGRKITQSGEVLFESLPWSGQKVIEMVDQ